jgi:hypothetical protein
MPKQTFWLPTRPFGLIAAINRRGAATGSIRGAMLSESADYNGHFVGFVEPNSFKRYWTCYYTWAGIHTIGRGSLADCLRAAKREYDRGALGAGSKVSVETEEDTAACLAAGFQPWSEEIEKTHLATWWDARFDLINTAADYEKWGIFPGAIGHLANSKTVEEFEAKFQAYKAERTARR